MRNPADCTSGFGVTLVVAVLMEVSANQGPLAMETAMVQEKAAAAELVEALEKKRRSLSHIFSSFHLSKEESEDIRQELALAAIRKSSEIRSFEAWLPAAAYRLCLHHVSKRSRLAQTFTEEVSADTVELACPPEQERYLFLLDLRKALQVLPVRHRKLLVLRVLQGLSSQELASRLGYHVSSARKVVQSASNRILAEIERGSGRMGKRQAGLRMA